jgi:hypothetical protein
MNEDYKNAKKGAGTKGKSQDKGYDPPPPLTPQKPSFRDRSRDWILWAILLVSGVNVGANLVDIQKTRTVLQNQDTIQQRLSRCDNPRTTPERQAIRDELQQMAGALRNEKNSLQVESPDAQRLAHAQETITTIVNRTIEIGRQAIKDETDEHFRKVLEEKVKLLEDLVGKWYEAKRRGDQQRAEQILDMIDKTQGCINSLLSAFRWVITDAQPKDFKNVACWG